jgi:hypothetical protein
MTTPLFLWSVAPITNFEHKFHQSNEAERLAGRRI